MNLCKFKGFNFLIINTIIILLIIFKKVQGCHVMYFDKEIMTKNVTYIAIEIKTKYCFADNRVCNYVNRIPKVKQVEEFQLIPKKKCCTGYEEISKDECVPKCNNCENGKCVYTDFCVCNAGYRRNYALNKCVSRCDVDCINGICIGNNECKCNEGYKLLDEDDNECIPECLKGNKCLNGDCIGPDICNCHNGYIKNNLTNICEPICNVPCINGICTNLNECTCHHGYQLKNNSDNICEPICSNGCPNGKCIDVEKCQCNDGYELSKNNDDNNKPYNTNTTALIDGQTIFKHKLPQICEPICEFGCKNGYCIKPNECQCFNGYKHIEDEHNKNNLTNLCIPKCDIECINGNCIAPNICECNIGYKHHPTNLTICEPMCIENCHKNGYCAEPNQCACNKGFLLKNSECLSECELTCKNGICNNEHNQCICSNGYEQNTTLQCIPVCKPHNCGNGICYKPNQCLCHHGYEYIHDLEKCMLPCPDNSICNKHINNELIITECYKGFEMKIDNNNNKTICEPICDKNCINGKCIGPNICECLPGYDNTNENLNICEPICEPLCQNGKCIKPNICECLPGFEYININLSYECTPICPNTNCTNGYCIGLNECKCLDGYKLSINDHMFCEPICNDPICNPDISKCIAPNICDCLDGYELTINEGSVIEFFKNNKKSNKLNQSNDSNIMNNIKSGKIITKDSINSICKPICDNINCTNGICIAPNKCECLHGYTFNNNEILCEPISLTTVEPKSDSVEKRKSGNLLTGILVTCGIGLCLVIFIIIGIFVKRKLKFQRQLNITASNFNLMNPIYDVEE